MAFTVGTATQVLFRASLTPLRWIALHSLVKAQKP